MEVGVFFLTCLQLLGLLRAHGEAATITPEIRRYLQDVVAFLRMERGVDGGISPYATTLFLALAKSVYLPFMREETNISQIPRAVPRYRLCHAITGSAGSEEDLSTPDRSGNS
jgi:hypothetical protein